ncbi:hypothetical protein AB9K35_17000 [Leisingera sp. XS_AS12]|uniref:hypothetical protein n=1 Tax=Leisingera sp. XS_AS12 TaxID=3241294 RepID=UPI003513224C
MLNFTDWFLVLFQPMPDVTLQKKLVQIGMPEGYWAILPLYLFLLFVTGAFLGAAIRRIMRSWRQGENTQIVSFAAGAAAAAFFLGGQILETFALFAPSQEVINLRVGVVPSFHAVHRALLPFDIEGITQFFIEGNFMRKLKLAFFYWQEDSRGLFIYPVIALACVLPRVRTMAIPALAGAFFIATVLPIIIGSFSTSLLSGLVILALLSFFSGALITWLQTLTGKG